MKSEQTSRRKRVSALVPPEQYRQLETMATEGREPVSRVVARIIHGFLENLKNVFGNEVEIEGCVNNQGIHIFQLREYEIPKRRKVKISLRTG